MPAFPNSVDFVAPDEIPVRVLRSAKRKKTISSQWRDNRLIIQVPAALDEKTERAFVDEMISKYRKGRQARTAGHTDDALERRAASLDQQYFAGAAAPQSVRWVANQNKRWGSASYRQRSIRLSVTLQHMPSWVQDYVLVHELAHLVAPRAGHGPRFQALLNRFERRAQADIFLEAFHAGYNAHAKELGRAQDELSGFGHDEEQ
ncbi:SprT-like domain-containing protein [Glutamicibacter sp. Je.9.36]|uniref:M48 family metallopeptidase n=1 Tax=Glutamicibacter sp. Je.9.36 TaxID=3142837 RepID=UPI003DAA0BB1